MKKRGFTLIELLVVISIISLLSSIVLSSLNSARAQGRDAQRVQNLRQVQLAIEQYIAVNGEAPLLGETSSQGMGEWKNLEVALSPYISSLPEDPCTDCETNWNMQEGLNPGQWIFDSSYFEKYQKGNSISGIRMIYRTGEGVVASCRGGSVGATSPSGGPCPDRTSYVLFYNAYETFDDSRGAYYAGINY
jgi:prepilin-type N-terminal cleavage/methylation domain-containing protein